MDCLVLDATPLITQSASALQQYANKFYTTPGVRAELRDEHARAQLLLWGDALNIRQPTQKSIDKVNAFAKLNGDYSVLSMNDVHIIALAYEIEVEQNGETNLRKFPGQQLSTSITTKPNTITSPRVPHSPKLDARNNLSQDEEEGNEAPEEDDGFQVVERKQRHTRKHYRQEWQKQMANLEHSTSEVEHSQEQENEIQPEKVVELEQRLEVATLSDETTGELDDVEGQEPLSKATEVDQDDDESSVYDEDDDDGEWITPENLQETIMMDDNETVQDTQQQLPLLVALSTGDFACQNTSMQIGLNLLNPQSGKQITKVRNYMYRCHACFHMLPMPKTGERKHFCPKCGGDTLLRCAVSVDNVSGKVTPHLKKNFQWITRGQVYSIASPLSKNSQKKFGRAGYQHNKENRHKALQNPVVLREDQKEYSQAVKDDAWHRKKNEKMLAEWIGGGSADNCVSPFQTSYKSAGVKVGRGRNANAVKKRK